MSRYYSRSSGTPWGLIFFGVVFLVWWVIAANLSGTRPVRTAETFGFTQVDVRSYHYWFPQLRGCGVGDMGFWRVSATNPQGKRVDFTVCGGMFKDNTIRVR
ncbi:MAG TPA: hypothetical protein VLA88_04290 [Candidatus Saccharimonadales bacterium]|nr:hypothetical protein [Candidatus Saccharimonadales bacterium]